MSSRPAAASSAMPCRRTLSIGCARQRGVGVGAWRGIAAGYIKFAIETMLDEVAASQRRRSDRLRLELLQGRSARGRGDRDGGRRWRIGSGSGRTGRALGIGYSDALRSYTAGIAEVSVDARSGQISVHHIWAAVDAGARVQPRNIAAQMESAMIMALGAALFEQVTIKNGVVQQANFDSYRRDAHGGRAADRGPRDLHRQSADRHRRGRHARGRAGDRQRGGAAHAASACASCRCCQIRVMTALRGA